MAEIAGANFFLALGAMLILFGILSSLIATRFGTPLLLVFLAIGMLAGEDGPGGILFDNYAATYLIGSCALAVILFDGGLRTRLSSIRGSLLPAATLATAGVVLTSVIVAAFAVLVFGIGWLPALLLGAIVASTDAAAVFFLLKIGGLQLKPRVGAVLEVESGSNDPVAVFLVILLTGLSVGAAGADGSGFAYAIEMLLRQTVLGAGFGLAAGLAVVAALNRLHLLSGMHPLFVVSSAVAVYGLTAYLDGSGFLAVYISGLVVGNRASRALPSIINFHDTATWLAQIVMFLVLGLLVTPTTLIAYAVPGLAIAAFLIVVGRPAAVWICLKPFGFSREEIAFVSWVGLRGAVSIFLAAIPTLAGVPGSELFFNVAFFVVMVSLLVQGWTIAAAARRFNVSLRRFAAPATRVDIDLPGQTEKELVGYAIAPDSFVALRPASLPDWLKPVMVVRDDTVLNAAEAGDLRVGDYAYFLVETEKVRRLDRLFAPLPHEAILAAQRTIFGEFPIGGDAPIGEVCRYYDLEAPAELADLTVREAFERRYGQKLRAGNRIDLGAFAFIVARSVDGHSLRKAGLRLEDVVDLSGDRDRATVPESAHRVLDALAWIRRLLGQAAAR